MEFNFHS